MDSIEILSHADLRTRNYVGRISTHLGERETTSPSVTYREQFLTAISAVESEMKEFDEAFHRSLQHDDADIAGMLSYVADLGGKRLRPSLLLLAAKCIGPTGSDTIRLAVVMELVHTATLIHDDVLDNALMRRHKPAVHQRWSTEKSILLGDWLFAQAYRIANEGESTIPGRWVADAAKNVCVGEIRQGTNTHDYRLSVEEYIRMIEGKTGELCAASCALGAWSVGGDSEQCEQLRLFGLKLGIAFQVVDDWLDVWGKESAAGKSTGRDLEAFKPTLPALFTLDKMPSSQRDHFIQLLLEGDKQCAKELRMEMDRCQASRYTKNFAAQWITSATEHLRDLPPSHSRNGLLLIAQSVVQRTV